MIRLTKYVTKPVCLFWTLLRKSCDNACGTAINITVQIYKTCYYYLMEMCLFQAFLQKGVFL
jgi:hypothetical protein